MRPPPRSTPSPLPDQPSGEDPVLLIEIIIVVGFLALMIALFFLEPNLERADVVRDAAPCPR